MHKIAKIYLQVCFDRENLRHTQIAKTVFIGDYPTLTEEQCKALIADYRKNPEPHVMYMLYSDRDILAHDIIAKYTHELAVSTAKTVVLKDDLIKCIENVI